MANLAPAGKREASSFVSEVFADAMPLKFVFVNAGEMLEQFASGVWPWLDGENSTCSDQQQSGPAAGAVCGDKKSMS